MRILIHDYAGHPFQAELSRELARRGHKVIHAFFEADAGPKGNLASGECDPEGLRFVPLGGEIAYSKTNFLRRRAGDLAYGRLLANFIETEQLDVVISGNTPTEAQEPLVSACRRLGIPFVYWCQDFYSIAVSRLLEAKIPGPGHLIGAWYRRLERRQMHRSSHVVLISEDFRAQTNSWSIPRDRIEIIPNWGAIDEIDVLPRDNKWSAEQDLGDGARFLYSGTLAMKHNPDLLVALEQKLGADEEVVLVSAGIGADALAARKTRGELKKLRLLPLQPFEDFAEVLASGDVLLAVIERDAGVFSVPSKILGYLCAARPIVLAAPAKNLAARMLIESGAGKVVEPDDVDGFVRAVLEYRDSPCNAAAAGCAGRAYAECNFGLNRVTDRFEALFQATINNRDADLVTKAAK